MAISYRASFSLKYFLLLAVTVGGVYFLPQFFYWLRWHSPQVLLEENFDEVAYAIWSVRLTEKDATKLDPHQISQFEPSFSFTSIQFLPAWLIGQLSILLHQPITVMMFLGSFIFPAVIGFFFASIAWFCGIKKHSSLALFVIFSLVTLPPVLWLMQFKYIVALLNDTDPGFHLSLPYSRRYQPQLTAVVHYAVITLSLVALQVKKQNYYFYIIILTGICFGASFYSYYFSWTILFGWFVLGGIAVRSQWPARLKGWIISCLIGVSIGVPYFIAIAWHFSDVSKSAASTYTRSFPADPAIWISLAISALLCCVMFYDSTVRNRLWAPFALNVVILLGSFQNIFTGIFIQPYHYLHYFGRPALNMGIVSLWCYVRQVFLQKKISENGLNFIEWATVVVFIAAAIIFQYARYIESYALGEKTINYQPAMQIINQQLPQDALVYCPDEIAREGLPLYTRTRPYFSRYMLLGETEITQPLIRERVATMQWLRGMSEEELSVWLEEKPVDVFFQELQHPENAKKQLYMQSVKIDILRRFNDWKFATKSKSLDSLGYALLPQFLTLDATRLPSYFHCSLLWADEHYSLYQLALR